MNESNDTVQYLYVTSSSYSGSTLLAFLLNAHPNIVSVSEMDGWRYSENETFLCSCGKALDECNFYKNIYQFFHNNGLTFDFRNFGTGYILSDINIVNRWLTTCISRVHNSNIEKRRDNLVVGVPSLKKKLEKIDRANEIFVRAALSYKNAQYFADLCKSPFRLRHLKRIKNYDIRIVYLTRNPMGVVHSMRNYSGLDVSTCIRLWLYEQLDIVRILDEFPTDKIIRMSYEEICNNINVALNSIYRFMQLESYHYKTKLELGEHHILGNKMRLRELSSISESTSWKSMPAEDQAIVRKKVEDFAKKIKKPILFEIINSYLDKL